MFLISNKQQQQQSPILEAQSFNNLLNANPFNHIFTRISPSPAPPSLTIDTHSANPSSASTTIIDLSSECDDDFEILPMGRKRQHSNENINENKRNRQSDHHSLYTENQKNVPLKKRGVSNSQRRNGDEVNFLNLIASEDSNQAQDLKIVCSNNSSTACDSTSSSNGNATLPKQHRNFHNSQPKEKVSDGSSDNPCLSSANSTICNCYEW